MAKLEIRLSPKFWLFFVGLWVLLLFNDTLWHPGTWKSIGFSLAMLLLTVWCYYREIARRRDA